MSQKCFTNDKCPYYPCHQETEGMAFNCMFCYCPLYALGKECGGNFQYLPNGVKDCSNCNLPHRGEDGWEHVRQHIGALINQVREEPTEPPKGGRGIPC
ncbi:MAG: cysteine-rich small domain-containing protein [Paludibacteraceae bacterium]|nr:cysteine-rich small domain-containing protein [Paludibacteraceae bacterium]